ncbi:MAG: site-specific DNA-methyltransferase [Candidatus Omnitrophica bacterium]|nr:site-specific DNA-methyltransferase [Candidatus Omnitrophota bacterium]
MKLNKKDIQNWSKDKLVREYKTLLKRKKFGIVWEDKKEDIAEFCKSYLPFLEENTKRRIITSEKDVNHIFIEGDNYHALSVLNYTHKRKIDVIFIDPPYNTGSQHWIYNNSYVEKEDRFKHSKWLSFMSKRLRLARNLLKENGFIAVTIDHNELFTLGSLMDEVFGENNRVGIVTILHNPKGRNQAKFFSENSEFLLLYAKNISKAQFNSVAISEDVQNKFTEMDDDGKFRYEPYMRARTVWSRKSRPKNWYPIYVSKDLRHITHKRQKGYYEVFPVTNNGKEMAWKNIKETFIELNKNGYFKAEKEKGKIVIYHKYREQQVLKNVWIDKKYQSEFHGTNLLKKILGDKRFDYPKSLYLVIDILKITSKKNAVVLDFFAGSGTTGHAVLEMNKDRGSRQFILCTNNENNNGNGYGGVAEGVCYPRIKKIIRGYSRGKEKIKGLGGNLRYYNTKFINNIKTDNDKRIFTAQSTDMICLAENTFDNVVYKKNQYAIFQNDDQMTGIIYDEDYIDCFKKKIRKYNQKPLIVYVFSYDYTYNEEDFIDIKKLVKVKPIPEVILNVYRKAYKRLHKTQRR